MDRSFGRLFRSHRKSNSYDGEAHAVQQRSVRKSRSQLLLGRRPGTAHATPASNGAVFESYTVSDDECGRPPTPLDFRRLRGNQQVSQSTAPHSDAPRRGRALTLGGNDRYMTDPSFSHYSEDVADRNLLLNATGRFPDPVAPVQQASRAVPITSGKRFSEDVAERNLVLADVGVGKGEQQPHQPVTVQGFKQQPIPIPVRSSSLQRTTSTTRPNRFSTGSGRSAPTPEAGLNHNSSPDRTRSNRVPEDSAPRGHVRRPSAPSSYSYGHQKKLSSSSVSSPKVVRKSSAADSKKPWRFLDLTTVDPMPEARPLNPPVQQRSNGAAREPNQASTPSHANHAAAPRFDSQAARAKSLKEAGLDMTNTEDVDEKITYAKPVVHETIQPTVHHIREEVITREIHNHDVYHRILPVIDVEILPTKHYIRDPETDQLVEIPEHLIPGGGTSRAWQIVDTLSRPDGQAREPVGRRFTARTFGPDEGKERVWIGEDGVSRSERTWVHPPTLEDGAYRAGQTQPLHFHAKQQKPHVGSAVDAEYQAQLTQVPSRVPVGQHSDGMNGTTRSTKHVSPIEEENSGLVNAFDRVHI